MSINLLKKFNSKQKIQEKLSIIQKQKLQQKLIEAQLAENGITRIVQFIDDLVQVVFREIIENGFAVPNQTIQLLSNAIKFGLQLVRPGETKKCEAYISGQFAKLFGKVISSQLPSIRLDSCPLLGLSLQRYQKLSEFEKPETGLQFLSQVGQLIPNFPQISFPSMMSTFQEFLRMMSGCYQGIITDYRHQLSLVDIYANYFAKITVSVLPYQNNSRLLVKSLQVQLNEFKRMLRAQFKSVEFGLVLRSMLALLEQLTKFIVHVGFSVELEEIFRNILNLTVTCLIQLRSESMPAPLLRQIREAVFALMRIRFRYTLAEARVVREAMKPKSLYSQIFRILDILFVYQKENFLKSNIEMRLKAKFYDRQARQMRACFTLQELMRAIEPDMFENGRVLLSVLHGLIEGFKRKDLEKIEQATRLLKKERRKQFLKEGEMDPEDILEEERRKKEEEEARARREQEEAANILNAERARQVEEIAQLEGALAAQQGKAGEEAKEEQGEAAQGEAEEETKEAEQGEAEVRAQQDERAEVQAEALNQEIKESEARLRAEFGVPGGRKGRLQITGDSDQEEGAEVLASPGIEEEGGSDSEAAGRGESRAREAEESRLLRLKSIDYFTLQTSEVTKLTVGQREMVEQILELIASQVLETYEQCMSKQAGNEVFELSYVGLRCPVDLLLTLMRKYPLSVPYVMEKKLRSVRIGFLQRHPELDLVDYALVMGHYSNYYVNEIVQLICSSDYLFIEEMMSVQSSSSFYSQRIFDRLLTWLKRCIELKQVYQHETGLSIIDGLLGHLRYFLQHKQEVIGAERVRKTLAVLAVLLMKAGSQQDHDIADELEVINLFNTTLLELVKQYFRAKTGLEWSQRESEDYMKFFLNKAFFEFFSAGSDAEQELAHAQFPYKEIYQSIPEGLQQNVPPVLRPEHADTFGRPLRSKSCLALDLNLTTTSEFYRTKADLLASVFPECEKQVEALYWQRQVLTSAILMKHADSVVVASKNKLAALYQFFEKRHKTIPFRQEHATAFYFNLMEVLKSDDAQILPFSFADQQYFSMGLLAQQHQLKAGECSLEQVLMRVLFNVEAANNTSILAQGPGNMPDMTSTIEDDRSEMQYRQQQLLQLDDEQFFREPSQFGKSVMDSELDSLVEAKKMQTKQFEDDEEFDENYEEDEDMFFVEEEGFPANAIQLYEIDLAKFKKSTYQQKRDMLEMGRQKHHHKCLVQKTLLNLERENALLAGYLLAVCQGADRPKEMLMNATTADFIKVQIQQAMKTFSEKEKRLLLLTWDEQFLALLPESLQRQSEQYKQQTMGSLTQKQLEQLEVEFERKNNQKKESVVLQKTYAFLESGGPVADEAKLTNTLLRNERLESVLCKKQFYLELPEFDDEFLVKILEKLHLVNTKSQFQLVQSLATIKRTINLLCLNPYNAFKLIDAVQFLLIGTVFKCNCEQLPGAAQIQRLLDYQIFCRDASKFASSKKNYKYYKSLILFSVLEDLINNDVMLTQIILYNYPLWSATDYQFRFGATYLEQSYVAFKSRFRPLGLFADMKVPVTFKGLMNEQGLSILQLCNMFMKWLNSERTVREIPYKDLQTDVRPWSFTALEKVMGAYFNKTTFEGDFSGLIQFHYPKFRKRWKDLYYDFLIDSIVYDIIENKNRLKYSGNFKILQELCKTFDTFLIFSKQFFTVASKKLCPEIKKAKTNLAAFKAKVKQEFKLTDMNKAGINDIIELFYSFEDSMGQFNTFFKEDMAILRLSIKDIIQIFNEICWGEQLKSMADEFEIKKQNAGQVEAEKWLAEQKTATRVKMIDKLKSAWLSEETAIIPFFAELLRYIQQSIAFCWDTAQGIPYVYEQFNLPLKSLVILYEFLYQIELSQELQNLKDDIYTEGTTLNQLQSKEYALEQQEEDALQAGIDQILAGSTLTKKQAEASSLALLYKTIRFKFLGLVCYFLTSGEIQNKKLWMNYMNKLTRSKKLDIDMKLAHMQ